ncbi:MAG: flavodoxin family protein [Candidatus Omnitrophota bacterium]
MRIVVVSSSPHKEKSSTFQLACEVLKGLPANDCAVEIIHLADCALGFCLHCEACHAKILDCSLRDDAMEIAKKMMAADGIILATPNYIHQVTGSMKTIFDRSGHFIHCKRFLDKYVVGVVTSGSGDNKEVLDYLKFYTLVCGGQYSGGVSAMRHLEKAALVEAFDLGAHLALDITKKTRHPTQVAFLERDRKHFAPIVAARKDEWVEEYRYWQKMGWL